MINLQPSKNITVIYDFFIYNNIKFLFNDIRNNGILDFNLLIDPDIHLSIVDFPSFIEAITKAESCEILVNFLQKNKLIVWNDGDGGCDLIDSKLEFKKLDTLIPKEHVTVVIDAKLDCNLELQNIKIVEMPCTSFGRLPLRKISITEVPPRVKDFILLMSRVKPHRDLTWEIITKNNLQDFGTCTYHKSPTPYMYRNQLNGWVGDLKNHNEFSLPFIFPHGVYETANFEIISESVADHIFYATEKTYKSIVAKMPFMVISTVGYLGYLRSLGFETFGSIIDESYDQEVDLEKRITMIATEAKRIINNGSQKFYNATRDICQHNYNTWAKNRGSWDHTMDNFLLNLLDL
jgi:hypothetical protein